ncbi:hypothetical protein [uncultured Tateyamaria sp.]|uniref:hypothetical protein n=1 Tax=uncultured Tateyamaria sp. TaxID=455651 RepID=UPI002610016D|nr:hypothetical protein [uncultured Tateyamaria sp.]
MAQSDFDAVLRNGQYDYIDFGCSKGGSLALGHRLLGGTKGIGVDVDERKVEQTIDAGFDAVVGDVTDLITQPNCTRFVTMVDFLEHLPSIDLAERCIAAACEAATDFVFIRQPWFDSDGYLFENGLKLYWSDWTGHPNAMTSLEIYRVLVKMTNAARWRIYSKTLIKDSSDLAVHPVSSPRDQHDYDVAKHGSKRKLKFKQPVYRQIGAIILLKDDPQLLRQIEKKTKWTKVLFDSGDPLSLSDLRSRFRPS